MNVLDALMTQNSEHAYDILKSLSGKEHTVVTGVCIMSPTQPPIKFYESTAVKFTNLSDEVSRYMSDMITSHSFLILLATVDLGVHQDRRAHGQGWGVRHTIARSAVCRVYSR